MLPRAHRLRSRREFSEVVRRGRRAAGSVLTVHLLASAGPTLVASPVSRAGLIVSRAVGPSVVRSRVARRLRHQLRDVLPHLPAGTLVVVRASPAAATASSARLDADLRSGVARLVGPNRAST